MYAYTYDSETGGILLLDELSQFSKEPRPVYSRELDILGFDSFWSYEKRDDIPYLWAESNFYWYRGKRVAKTVGGSLYEKPGIELERGAEGGYVLAEGSVLQPVDLHGMVEKNALRIAALEQQTIKKIYAAYHKYEKKLDCFHVAFSGGKDSIVLLELVKRALPRSTFMVILATPAWSSLIPTRRWMKSRCVAMRKVSRSIARLRISNQRSRGSCSGRPRASFAGVAQSTSPSRRH